MRSLIVAVALTVAVAESEAAITITELASGSQTTPYTTVTTASVSPTSGALLLLMLSYNTTNCGTSSVTGLSITWSNVRQYIVNGGVNHAEIYRAVSTGGTGTVTMSFSASCNRSMAYSLVQVTGADTGSGTQGIVSQIESNLGSCSPCNVSATLGTFSPSTNAFVGLCGVGNIGSSVTWTLDPGASNWVELSQKQAGSGSTFWAQQTVAFTTRNTADVNFDCAASGLGGSSFAILAGVEISTGATPKWFSGVEVGSVNAGAATQGMSEFTQYDTGSRHVADTTTIKTGAYALKLTEGATNGGFAISKKSLGLKSGFFRTWFRFDGAVSNSQSVARWLNAAQTIETGVYINTSSQLFWRYNGGAAIVTGSTVLSPNTWYLIEGDTYVMGTGGGLGAASGGTQVKLNGVVEFASFATDTSSITALDQLQIGPALNQAGTVRNFYYDDIMVCSSSYCPSGKTIARQGTAGTPTYNAWTKNSCTGGTIDGCWSDTPPNTTSNASSTTGTQAQTMIVSSFSSTQTGHGPEYMNGHETVNACKSALVLRNSAGANSIKIRRRIDGVDSDTAGFNLSTTDTLYDDGPWTTSASSLFTAATPEIGVVQNAGGATEIASDGWLICDVSDPATIQHKTTQD